MFIFVTGTKTFLHSLKYKEHRLEVVGRERDEVATRREEISVGFPAKMAGKQADGCVVSFCFAAVNTLVCEHASL